MSFFRMNAKSSMFSLFYLVLVFSGVSIRSPVFRSLVRQMTLMRSFGLFSSSSTR